LIAGQHLANQPKSPEFSTQVPKGAIGHTGHGRDNHPTGVLNASDFEHGALLRQKPDIITTD
tara:strand:- start:542 stop:727 length:186 start_codon:yes stop_codon:yes gene_type:complete